ncbi:MAG: conjugal transfer protein TraA, partial [Phenylobacterium sp.]|nr:conjugal transfer protein TraA [Phenylobacterium sp.]
SGIESRTLASLEHAWARGRDGLERGDVLVIDEAGLVGSRQLERVLARAEQAGAKVVLVGDAEQLQAIEAGAAFRALAERQGAAEITDIRRQLRSWQQAATRQLATGRTEEALAAYQDHEVVAAHDNVGQAAVAMVQVWQLWRDEQPERSHLMLAYTRAEVDLLNQLARERLAAAGQLVGGSTIATTRGPRSFARGDRLIFLRNERSLGVRNGSLGTVTSITGGQLQVRLDDGREVAFGAKDYADFDHGYAITIHKAQGSTVDYAHVLASPFMDRHATYVALSRHRAEAVLHFGRDQFAGAEALRQCLSRERTKDTTLDYLDARSTPARERARAGNLFPKAAMGPPMDREAWPATGSKERERTR